MYYCQKIRDNFVSKMNQSSSRNKQVKFYIIFPLPNALLVPKQRSVMVDGVER